MDDRGTSQKTSNQDNRHHRCISCKLLFPHLVQRRAPGTELNGQIALIVGGVAIGVVMSSNDTSDARPKSVEKGSD